MKLGIMQAYFFPYIGYFQLINAVDKFILYEHVNFRNKSWMTRNYILPINAKVQSISISVRKKSCNKTISDIELVEFKHFSATFLKKIYHSYRRTQFFDETIELFENIFNTNFSSLHHFNSFSITEICSHLGINTIIKSQNENYLYLEEELSTSDFNSNNSNFDKKSARIISICKNENANIYFNAIGGTALYDKINFYSQGITLNFIKTNDLIYKQFNETFIPNLSIIDVLMHNGINTTKILLNNYQIL